MKKLLGVSIPEGTTLNLEQVKKRKDELIKKSVDGMTTGIEINQHLTLIKGIARFTDMHTV